MVKQACNLPVLVDDISVNGTPYWLVPGVIVDWRLGRLAILTFFCTLIVLAFLLQLIAAVLGAAFASVPVSISLFVRPPPR